MTKKNTLKEQYKEVFFAGYSSRRIYVVECSSVKNKHVQSLLSKDMDYLITSSLSSHSSLQSHFKKIVAMLNNSSIDIVDKKKEIVVATQPHKDVMVAGYVFDREWIRVLADYSLGLGLTLVKPEHEDTMSLLEKRKSIFTSRQTFSWDMRKYMYSNHCEAEKLVGINFTFTGKNLKPDAVTEVMGIEADSACFKGQPIESKIQRKACTGVWRIICEDYEDGHKTLHAALKKSLNDLYKYRKRIFQVAQDFGCESYISIAFEASFNSNNFEHYRFSPSLFKALVPFGIDLALSIWIPQGCNASDGNG